MRLLAGPTERRSGADDVLARSILETSSEAYICVGANGLVLDWSPAAERLFGLSRDEAVGQRLESLVWRGKVSPPGAGGLAEALVNPPGEQRAVVQRMARIRGGKTVPVEVAIARCSGPGGATARAFVRDLSPYMQPDTSVRRDPLTGLPPANALPAMLARALQHDRPRGGLVAICHVDVDRTGFFNEALGHDAGDALLIALVERIATVTRQPKRIVRYGGDEFVAVLDQLANLDDVTALATRLSRAMAKPVVVAQREVFPSASIGIAVTDPLSRDEPGDLVARASLATRRVKQRGGDGWELFDRSMSPGALAQLDLEAELRLAVERDELRLHYQPIVTTHGEPWGYEALVRWQHPERGLVGPAEFLLIAEATGLIGPTGDWVLRQAARQMVGWGARVPGLRLAVNLSTRQLAEPDLVARISHIIEDEGLPPEALSVEVTESALLSWSGGSASSLAALAGLGVSITLNDYGVGYASLHYLRRFPIERIKLDRYFLPSIARNPVAFASTVGLAHGLGLEVVAVGIETAADLKLASGAGCDLVQGHFVASPRPAEQVTPSLGERVLFDGSEQVFSVRWGDESASGSGSGGNGRPVAGAYPSEAPIEGAEGGGPRRRVLVVQARRAAREALAAAISAHPSLAVVGQAEQPEAALELATTCQPDVVVVDLALSGDDGLHLLPELLRRAPQARLVVLSAFVTPAVERAMEARGADACIDSRSPGEAVAATVAELSPLDTVRPPMSLPEVIASTNGAPGILASTLRPVALQDLALALETYLDSAIAGRAEEAIQQVIDLRRAGAALEQLVDGLLGAAARELATRFEAGKVPLADLKVATAITGSALDALAPLSTAGPALGLVAHVGVAGDEDVLPGRLLAELLHQRSWQTVRLGATPLPELADFLRRRRVDAVLVSCSSPVYLDGVAALVAAVHRAGRRVLASGAAFGTSERRAAQLGADGFAVDAASAARVLGQWRVERYDARMAPTRTPILGPRAEDIGMRAAAFARAASASYGDPMAGLVEMAVRGALAALLVDDETVVAEVAATLRRAARAASLPTASLAEALADARDDVATWDPHGIAAPQLEAVLELLGEGRGPAPATMPLAPPAPRPV